MVVANFENVVMFRKIGIVKARVPEPKGSPNPRSPGKETAFPSRDRGAPGIGDRLSCWGQLALVGGGVEADRLDTLHRVELALEPDAPAGSR